MGPNIERCSLSVGVYKLWGPQILIGNNLEENACNAIWGRIISPNGDDYELFIWMNYMTPTVMDGLDEISSAYDCNTASIRNLQ